MQRGRRSERPTERVEVRGGAVLGVVPDEGMMREIEGDSSADEGMMRGIEGDRGRFIRGTRYHSEVIKIIKLHSEVVREREPLNSNQPFGGIRATWALKEGLQRGNQTQSDAINSNQPFEPHGR
jgi:hypothetical protein